MQVTRATSEDATVVADVLTDAAQYKLRHGDFSWGSNGITVKAALERISNSQVYVITVDGKTIVTGSLEWDDEYYWGPQPAVAGYIHRLAVDKLARGRGVGAFFLEWAV